MSGAAHTDSAAQPRCGSPLQFVEAKSRRQTGNVQSRGRGDEAQRVRGKTAIAGRLSAVRLTVKERESAN